MHYGLGRNFIIVVRVIHLDREFDFNLLHMILYFRVFIVQFCLIVIFYFSCGALLYDYYIFEQVSDARDFPCICRIC